MDNLSDEELRSRLTSTGQRVGPITNTTRGVYIKLLQQITQETSTQLKREPTSEHSEETFTIPKKKKKGIPMLQVPSLRRSTIESTALSKKLAAESSTLKKTGMSNLNRVNLNTTIAVVSAPHYMRGTSNSIRKGDSVRGRIAKGGRKSFRRAGRPLYQAGVYQSEKKENEVPKVVGSAINKAKDKGKKKRAPWDVKGRLEDVTHLYNDLKEEKRSADELAVQIKGQLDEYISQNEELQNENTELRASLITSEDSLNSSTKTIGELEFRLNEVTQEKNEKCSVYTRVKHELSDLEEDFCRIKCKLRESDNNVDDLDRDLRRTRNAKEEVEDKLEKSNKCGVELGEQVETLKKHIKMIEDTVSKKNGTIDDIERTLTLEREEAIDMHVVLRKKETAILDLGAKISSMENTITNLTSTVTKRDCGIEALEGALKLEQRGNNDVISTLREREATISKLQQQVAQCFDEMQTGEALRRKLHNIIQELKGNIRVYCRVRPFLNHEIQNGQPVDKIPHMDFNKDSTSLIVTCQQGEKLGRKGEIQKHDFSFDHVFGPEQGQEDTYAEVSGLVQSALDGYNVCIFAYGQTGSGKTHTMQGTEDPTSYQRGVIPRAMEQVFKAAQELASRGWEYKFSASFLEIYNENLYDLISSTSEKIEIKLVNEKSRTVEVTNVKNVIVENTYDVHQLLSKANKKRSVAATKCNERSSRSHAVFRLKIEGHNGMNGEACVGNLNLVDLAGSERVANSGSTGQRLKEAQAINTSLSELGNVIMSLNSKKAHIPYRNSKLTYLLCNSLGGNSKTLMFVNVSPLDNHTQETVNSLRFASKVNRVDIGTAKKNK